jgi:hypothetical protein
MTTIFLQTLRTITEAPYLSAGVDISPSTYGFSTAGPGSGLKIYVRVTGADPSNPPAAVIQIQSAPNGDFQGDDGNLVHATFSVAPGPLGATSTQSDQDEGEGNAPSSLGFTGTGTAFPVNPQTFVVGLNDQNVGQIPWGEDDAQLGVTVALLNAAHLTFESWFTY